MYDFLNGPWPWYVAGPLIGLFVPLLMMMGRRFGVSSSLRHVCAAAVPGTSSYFQYDWREHAWNGAFVVGIALGGVLTALLLPGPGTVHIAEGTRTALAEMGVVDQSGLAPESIFGWRSLRTVPGFVIMVLGGFLIGFGARAADGCTSGQAIAGLSELKLSSLVVVIGFFAGGLFTAHIVLPWLLEIAR